MSIRSHKGSLGRIFNCYSTPPLLSSLYTCNYSMSISPSPYYDLISADRFIHKYSSFLEGSVTWKNKVSTQR